MSPGPTGIHLDSTLENHFKAAFTEAKTCGGFEKGEFADISIVIMPPWFKCKAYENGCQGQYTRPNLILISAFSLWKHEVIHYLLDLNTGDPDKDHKNNLFKDCA